MITKINAYIYTHTNVLKKKKKKLGGPLPHGQYMPPSLQIFFFLRIPSLQLRLHW